MNIHLQRVSNPGPLEQQPSAESTELQGFLKPQLIPLKLAYNDVGYSLRHPSPCRLFNDIVNDFETNDNVNDCFENRGKRLTML